MTQLTIIGSGAWGTALGAVAQRAGSRATLWARDPAIAEAINTRRENPVYLPGIALDPTIRATADIAAALSGASATLRARGRSIRQNQANPSPIRHHPPARHDRIIRDLCMIPPNV